MRECNSRPGLQRLKGFEVSKKDKSKFHRRLKAEILKEITATSQEKPLLSPSPSPIAKPISPPKPEPDKNPVPGTGLTLDASLDTLHLVRADLRKSAIIIGSIIILIVALYFINQKTGILLKAGNEIFKILHIGG